MQIFSGVGILTVSLATLACGETFIDLPSSSYHDSGQFYHTAQDLEQAVIAAYDPLQDEAQYGGPGYHHFMEVRSDNTYNDNVTQEGGALAAFDNFVLAPSNPQINATWLSCYQGIQRCNIVLSHIDDIPDIDPQRLNMRKAEVLFIRALTYFNVVRIWGDAPLITEALRNPLEALSHVRNSTQDIYRQIIDDLTFAAGHLPQEHPAEDRGRATWGAAMTLLGKVHLTLAQYVEAVQVLEAVIQSGRYRLLNNFEDIFATTNKNHVESIFEIQFLKSSFGEGNEGIPASDLTDANNRPSPDLLALFHSENDARLDPSVDTLPGGVPHSAKMIDVRGIDGTLGHNAMVLRYADVLLMAAEGLNKLQLKPGKALRYLNTVRKRAGARIYSTMDLPDVASFHNALHRERRLELAFENHRWFDLLRTNLALQVMQQHQQGGTASALSFTISPHQLLYPIPQVQIDASGGMLSQNPGYH